MHNNKLIIFLQEYFEICNYFVNLHKLNKNNYLLLTKFETYYENILYYWNFIN
jgi:hypothetical protein